MSENQVPIKKDIGQQVIDRVNKLSEVGMTFAKDYNFVNAIKASMLALQEVVDKSGRPALEVCTPNSIQTSLFRMVTKSLDVSKNQAYFVVYGNKLKLQPSYFGNILQVKRLFPKWSPVAHTIREGDEFVYTIDPTNGKMKLVKHEQKLENLDKDFVGAYMYLPCEDGESELYVMTRKQILKAWGQSKNTSLTVHKNFDEKMAIKTLINSGCTKVINSTPDPQYVYEDEEDPNNFQDQVGGEETNFVDFEEVQEEQKEVVEEQPKEEPQQTTQEQPNDDEF